MHDDPESCVGTMSIRLHVATQLLQAMITSGADYQGTAVDSRSTLARSAVLLADVLIAESNAVPVQVL